MKLLNENGFKCAPLQNRKELVMKNYVILRKLRAFWFATRFHLRINRNESCVKFLQIRYQNYSVDLESLNSHDLLVMFDLDFLGFLINQPKQCRYVMDLREIYPEQYGNSLSFRYGLRPIRKYLLREHFHLIDMATTVSIGLQEYYSKEFGIKTSLIKSTPHYAVSKSIAKVAEPFKIVYLGVAHPLRKLEDFIKACDESENELELHFYLVGDPAYIHRLRELSAKKSRVFIHDSVPFRDIHETLTQFDLGWCYFSPETENIAKALPNKFFDYVQAGLGVVCGPNLDMIRESTPWGFGIFTQDFSQSALVKLLNSLSVTRVEELKTASREAAKSLHFGVEGRKLLDVLVMTWKAS